MEITRVKIFWVLISVFVLLVSVALHEFGHAIVAHKLGDDTPKRQGRVTLNPLAHADVIGTLLLPLIGGLYGAGFGWGKPVEWQPHRITRKVSMSTAKVLVAVAGPGMNLVLGSLLAIVHVVLLVNGLVTPLPINAPADTPPGASEILGFAVLANFVLFFFNLLPIPPLDGGHVAQSFTPYRHRDRFDAFARFAPFALLLLMLTPQLQVVFTWPANQVRSHLYEGLLHLLM